MSSPASRQRQRQRRRARERLWAAQALLAEREADLAAYERVDVDMVRRYREPAPLVSIACRLLLSWLCVATRSGTAVRGYVGVVADLEHTVADLEPRPEATA